jgi:hypothetical protein
MHALISRLKPDHDQFKKINNDYLNHKAGFGGEENFDKHLLEFKPGYPHAILNGLCLKHDNVFFEMDSVLITPSFVVIFEVKNIAGKLVYKTNPHRLEKNLVTGEITSMKSPVAELLRKNIFLRAWLAKRGVNIPLNGIVAHAYTNELTPVDVPDIHITFAYQVPTHLYSLPLENELLNEREIMDLAHKMVNGHNEYNPFPMINTKKISRQDILLGVFCPACGFRGMIWHRQKWICPKCRITGHNCHIDAIIDWFYLIDTKITNKDFRTFTQLSDRNVASRLVRKSELVQRGEKRGSYYVMKSDMEKGEWTLPKN